MAMRCGSRLALKVVVVGGAMLMLGGCSDPLFPKNQPRSPYERYAQLRGQAPRAQRHTFGIDKPTLRKRLKPMDTP